MDWSVSIEHQDAAAVVVPVGDVDLATSPELADAITGAVNDQPAGASVLVDLSQVQFCDSSGIRALVHGRRLADEKGVAYRVVGATGLVLDTLEMTGVWSQLSGLGA